MTNKHSLFRPWLITVMMLTLYTASLHAYGNDYLEKFQHYSVMSMGNGVLRFNIPIWVWGNTAENDYYLYCCSDANSTDDSYIWYSSNASASRGGGDVHRCVSFGAYEKDVNDGKGPKGKGYILVHEGSIIVRSTYDGTPLTRTPANGWQWDLELKRKSDDGFDHITYLEFDWYPPTSLENNDFYVGVSADDWKKGGNRYDKYWWEWPDKYTGGNIPQSPQLMQPYFYAVNENGPAGRGNAAIQYMTYQDPISYTTSLNSTPTPTSDRSGSLYVHMEDTVRHNFSAAFTVKLDASQQQTLNTNRVDIPAYHKLYDLTALELLDNQLSVTGDVTLSWNVHTPNETDAMPSDVFEIQRAFKDDYSDAQSVGVVSFSSDSSSYHFTENVVSILAQDTVDSGPQALSMTQETIARNGEERLAEFATTFSCPGLRSPGKKLYYRVRRASSSIWGWDHDYALSTMLDKNDFLAPIADTLPDYTLDPDFEDNRKVHFYVKIDNQPISREKPAEDDCELSIRMKRTYQDLPITFYLSSSSLIHTNPINYDSLEYVLTYTSPRDGQTYTLTPRPVGHILPMHVPGGSTDVKLSLSYARRAIHSVTHLGEVAMPIKGTIAFSPSTSVVAHVAVNFQEITEGALIDSLTRACNLNVDSIRHAMYEQFCAQLDTSGTARCNWDNNATLYLRRIFVETGDTVELAIPRDSIIRQADGSWLAHMVDVASHSCIHYKYAVRLDQTNSTRKVHFDSQLLPKPISGPDLYTNTSAKVKRFEATQGTDKYGVLLTWEPTSGSVDQYQLSRRDHGSTVDYDTILVTTDTHYRDSSAIPNKEYDYRLDILYTCNDTTTVHSATTTGRRSPYGSISGLVHYEDGIGCAGVQVTIESINGTDTVRYNTLTDTQGAYLFDSLLYGDGTDYTITPTSQSATFHYNNTSSGSATIRLDMDHPVAELIEFDNISSVRFTGRVLYRNSSIPVRDASLLLNGNPVRNASGLVLTDVSGDFSLRVPQGSAFTLQAVKEGHGFEGDGFVRVNGDSLITLTDAQDGVRIWDTTKVCLAGRIVGGLNQAKKTLGFGLSQNNLGDNIRLVLELEGDNTSYIVRVPDDLTKDTLEYAVPHLVWAGDTLQVVDTVGTTLMHYEQKRIIIEPDPETGEFSAMLFPVRYKLTQAVAQGYSSLFAHGKTSETIDLSNSATSLQTFTNDGKRAFANSVYNLTYRSPIDISCIQMRYGILEPYYGELAIQRQNVENKTISIPLAEKDTAGNYRYLFGAPVFNSQNYDFLVSAHEDYYYNNLPSGRHEEVRIHGGTLKVYNGMFDNTNTQVITKQLDQNGEARITIPIDYVSFLKTGEQALRVLDMSVESEGEFIDKQVLSGYVMGDRLRGIDYVTSTHATTQLLDILRDPPGAHSYAYLEKGTSYRYDFSYDYKFVLGLNISVGWGTSMNTFMGSYAGSPAAGIFSGLPYQANNYNKVTIPIKAEYYYKHSGSYSFSTDDRIETSSDTYSVGEDADVYIGLTQNVYFAVMDAVKPIDSLTYATLSAQSANGSMKTVAQGRSADGKPYYLAIGTEVETGPYLNSTFHYTHAHIRDVLLPELVRQRNALLYTGDKTTLQAIANGQKKEVYRSLVAPTDPNFGTDTTYYEKIVPNDSASLAKIWPDRVSEYNKQITDWIIIVKNNELEKVNAIYSNRGENIGTWSISGGTKVSHSESYSFTNSFTSKFDLPGLSANPGQGIADFFRNASKDFADGIMNTWAKAASRDPNTGDMTGTDPVLINSEVPGGHLQLDITPVFDFAYNRNPANTASQTKKTGFVLQPDAFGHMDVSVYRMVDTTNVFNVAQDTTGHFIDTQGVDYKRGQNLYGSYVYFLNGGASRCPWEAPDSTEFYTPKMPLSAGTRNLEEPKLDIDVHERSNVPYDQPAVFNLRMSNEGGGNPGTSVTFRLKVADSSNPKGAKIYVDGTPLSGAGRDIGLSAGQILNKTMEVYAGEGYDFENLVVQLSSSCYSPSVSKATFSVHYMPVSSPVNIAAPHDKWILNTLSPKDDRGYYMPVTIDGFDVNYKNFDHIEFQYKLSTQSDDAWVNLCSYYASDSLYNAASGTKAMIANGKIDNVRFYGERDPIEQKYDLRAISFCRHGNGFVTRTSPVLSGIKDTRPPRVFGDPEPANAILGVGDKLLLRFNEPIAGNYLDEDNNFQLLGTTNGTGITSSTSVHFDGTFRSYAQTKINRNLAGKSFSIDMLVRPASPSTEEVFFRHGEDGSGLVFGKTSDNRLYARFGSSESIYSKPLSELMTAFTRVILVYDEEKQKLQFFAGTMDVTDDSSAGNLKAGFSYKVNAPLCFGRGLLGNMLEARVWTKPLTAEEIVNTHLVRMTGYERKLAAYYPMNEGKGDVLNDKANGATLYMQGASWAMPEGISLAYDGTQNVKLDQDNLSRSNTQDFTLMFWFKTFSSNATLFSAGRKEATDSTSAQGTWIGFREGELLFRNGDLDKSTGNYSDDGWHHYVLTVNRTANTASIFVDGQLRNHFASENLGPLSGTMYLGADSYQGNIDEFVLYEQALPKSLVEAYDNIALHGDEMGLLAYLPFEERKENASGIMETVFTPNNCRIFKDTEGNVVDKVQRLILSPEDVDSMADRTDDAPVRDRSVLTKMNFDWAFNQDELLINLNMLDREINKQNIYVTVRDVEDLNGNRMVSPMMWQVFVDKNSLKWEKRCVTFRRTDGDAESDNYYDIKINNNSGRRHQYTIEQLPDWLSVDEDYGALNPEEEKFLRLTFNTAMEPGVYSELIYLTDENDLSEPLHVEYTIETQCPWDDVDKRKYAYTMSLCGQVKVKNNYDADTRDKVVVTYRNECVGMANVSFNNQTLISDIYLTIYGNDDMLGEALRFQLWQASTGRIITLIPDRDIRFRSSQMIGCGSDSVVIFSAGGSETQNLTLLPGWNWTSFNLYLRQDESGRINDVMVASEPWTKGDQIKNPFIQKFCDYSSVSDCFVGPLTHFHYSWMNMIYCEQGNTIRVSGDALPADSMLLTIRGGRWNAFPCLFATTTPVSDALADYYDNATVGDVLKNHDHFAFFSREGKWVGDLASIRPGEGYMLYRQATGDVTLHFYEKSLAPSPRRLPENAVEEPAFRNPKAATNMTMIAKLTEPYEGAEQIKVYVNHELAGLAVPQVVSGDTLLFITISSDQIGELHFELERNGRVSALSPVRPLGQYKAHVHYGSTHEPILLQPMEDDCPYKIIEDNHVFIIRNGERYDLTGKKVTK